MSGFHSSNVLKMNLSSVNCKLCDMFAKIARQTTVDSRHQTADR